MIIPFAHNIWICESELKLYNVEMGARMTVVDLDGCGNLLIHSPIKANLDLVNEIKKLGRVNYVIAPNRWHHLFVADFKREYPSAKFYCAPGLETKRPDFKFDFIIDETQKFPWNPNLEHKLVKGVPFFNEVVLFHPKSKTLITTDLVTNICNCKSLSSRLFLKILGAYKNFGWSGIEKIFYIRNKNDFYQSIDSILTWEFERIIMSHGNPILSNGHSLLEKAFNR